MPIEGAIPFVDPSGRFLYVLGDMILTEYLIDPTTGTLTAAPEPPYDLDVAAVAHRRLTEL